MGSAWDNLTKVFDDARERRQSTSWGERLAGGLRDNFGGGAPAESGFDFSKSTWGSIIDKYAQTPPIRPTGGQSGGPVEESEIVDKLVERGLPIHVATAFAWNMKDESGLDPGITELNPTVKGSRGGFGLYQLTGSRRRQYEQFASSRGVDASDVDAQLDFLVHELETTESNAAQSIYGASTTGQAADAIVRNFLRPHESHRERRSANYLKRDTGGYTPVRQEPIRSWNDLL